MEEALDEVEALDKVEEALDKVEEALRMRWRCNLDEVGHKS